MAVPERAVKRHSMRTLKLRAALLPLILLTACATQGPGQGPDATSGRGASASAPPVALRIKLRYAI